MQLSMRRHKWTAILLFLLLFTAISEMRGKVFINHPSQKDGDEVWFRSSFELKELPDSASLTLTTSGYVLAYINGRIAFPEIIWPYRPLSRTIERGNSLPPLRQYTTGMATRTINVRPLLNRGRNVIALWYAPCVNIKNLADKEHWMAMPDSIRKPLDYYNHSIHQVSPSLTVKKNDRSRMIVGPESNWLCHIASSRITINGEDTDATEYIDNWKGNDFSFNSTWVAAERSWTEMMEWNTLHNDMPCIGRITEAKKNYSTGNQQIYYIPYEMSGLLRITLRDTRKGQELTVNGMRYRCLGIEDEQIFTRFATITTDSISITNNSKRAFPDIQRIEMIELKPNRKSMMADVLTDEEEREWERDQTE